MWHKADWMGHLMRLELTLAGLLVKLTNHYTTWEAQDILKVVDVKTTRGCAHEGKCKRRSYLTCVLSCVRSCVQLFCFGFGFEFFLFFVSFFAWLRHQWQTETSHFLILFSKFFICLFFNCCYYYYSNQKTNTENKFWLGLFMFPFQLCPLGKAWIQFISLVYRGLEKW